MRCQKCSQQATFHITEVTGTTPAEHHLCEEHAKEYLKDSPQQTAGLTATLSKGQQNNMLAELQELDTQTCPVCGISFFDFRSSGRLGCAGDYTFFQKQLNTLLTNIHGSDRHIGKIPKQFHVNVEQHTLLMKLRRDLDDAVQYEEYERAAALRDKIKELT